MDQIEYPGPAIGQSDARTEAAMRPFAEATARLETRPGIGRASVRVIVTGIGVGQAAGVERDLENDRSALRDLNVPFIIPNGSWTVPRSKRKLFDTSDVSPLR